MFRCFPQLLQFNLNIPPSSCAAEFVNAISDSIGCIQLLLQCKYVSPNCKGQANALGSIILGVLILGCSSRMCNKAVRGDMGIDTLRSHRDKAELKWWYKLVSMPEDRYPKQLFSQEWNIKPRRGRQRGRVVDDLFVALGIDKGEYLHDVEGGDSLVASFMASVEECSIISERECKLYNNLIPMFVTLQCSCAGYVHFHACI